MVDDCVYIALLWSIIAYSCEHIHARRYTGGHFECIEKGIFPEIGMIANKHYLDDLNTT